MFGAKGSAGKDPAEVEQALKNNQINVKYQPPLDPFEVESDLKLMVPTQRFSAEKYQEWAAVERLANPYIDQLLASESSEQAKNKINREFVLQFMLWLQGKSGYNLRVDPTGTRFVTPWKKRPLTFLPGCSDYLRSFLTKKAAFQMKIAELYMRGPKDLNECFIYYKYIVVGMILDDEDFLGDAVDAYFPNSRQFHQLTLGFPGTARLYDPLIFGQNLDFMRNYQDSIAWDQNLYAGMLNANAPAGAVVNPVLGPGLQMPPAPPLPGQAALAAVAPNQVQVAQPNVLAQLPNAAAVAALPGGFVGQNMRIYAGYARMHFNNPLINQNRYMPVPGGPLDADGNEPILGATAPAHHSYQQGPGSADGNGPVLGATAPAHQSYQTAPGAVPRLKPPANKRNQQRQQQRRQPEPVHLMDQPLPPLQPPRQPEPVHLMDQPLPPLQPPQQAAPTDKKSNRSKKQPHRPSLAHGKDTHPSDVDMPLHKEIKLEHHANTLFTKGTGKVLPGTSDIRNLNQRVQKRNDPSTKAVISNAPPAVLQSIVDNSADPAAEASYVAGLLTTVQYNTSQDRLATLDNDTRNRYLSHLEKNILSQNQNVNEHELHKSSSEDLMRFINIFNENVDYDAADPSVKKLRNLHHKPDISQKDLAGIATQLLRAVRHGYLPYKGAPSTAKSVPLDDPYYYRAVALIGIGGDQPAPTAQSRAPTTAPSQPFNPPGPSHQQIDTSAPLPPYDPHSARAPTTAPTRAPTTAPAPSQSHAPSQAHAASRAPTTAPAQQGPIVDAHATRVANAQQALDDKKAAIGSTLTEKYNKAIQTIGHLNDQAQRNHVMVTPMEELRRSFDIISSAFNQDLLSGKKTKDEIRQEIAREVDIIAKEKLPNIQNYATGWYHQTVGGINDVPEANRLLSAEAKAVGIDTALYDQHVLGTLEMAKQEATRVFNQSFNLIQNDFQNFKDNMLVSLDMYNMKSREEEEIIEQRNPTPVGEVHNPQPMRPVQISQTTLPGQHKQKIHTVLGDKPAPGFGPEAYKHEESVEESNKRRLKEASHQQEEKRQEQFAKARGIATGPESLTALIRSMNQDVGDPGDTVFAGLDEIIQEFSPDDVKMDRQGQAGVFDLYLAGLEWKHKGMIQELKKLKGVAGYRNAVSILYNNFREDAADKRPPSATVEVQDLTNASIDRFANENTTLDVTMPPASPSAPAPVDPTKKEEPLVDDDHVREALGLETSKKTIGKPKRSHHEKSRSLHAILARENKPEAYDALDQAREKTEAANIPASTQSQAAPVQSAPETEAQRELKIAHKETQTLAEYQDLQAKIENKIDDLSTRFRGLATELLDEVMFDGTYDDVLQMQSQLLGTIEDLQALDEDTGRKASNMYRDKIMPSLHAYKQMFDPEKPSYETLDPKELSRTGIHAKFAALAHDHMIESVTGELDGLYKELMHPTITKGATGDIFARNVQMYKKAFLEDIVPRLNELKDTNTIALISILQSNQWHHLIDDIRHGNISDHRTMNVIRDTIDQVYPIARENMQNRKALQTHVKETGANRSEKLYHHPLEEVVGYPVSNIPNPREEEGHEELMKEVKKRKKSQPNKK